MLPRNTALTDAHLLVVDDQLEQLQLLIGLLRNAGCRISVGFDGSQAYQRALAISPDLILMDVRMPRMDGFAACRLLAADPRTCAIPVIFLTVAGDLHERLDGLEIGGVDYVVKPFEAAEVLARIRVHLTRVNGKRHVEEEVSASDLTSNSVIVRAAIRHLSQRLNNPPTVERLAHLVGTNEKRLSRAFRDNLGRTVFEYLRDERLRIAQRLLSSTSLSIASIAEEIGFSSAANFATAFRERLGMTPSTYREELRCRDLTSTREPALNTE
ncbi:AraC family transcriptional regulator [Caballeronia mineralivorans PML1(12)]|uniref:AraC family transcriptional regulator n=1 Tax=Caballeronia mineralivorans PML1(12) TaxID=908627 RepID=A0A0J1CU25_9BURK|nr:helix-turn-helix domain-containing protein [Caballeronia mineralivorans]KLU24099.1 AraC family transcriptional regulator [Caballeronia mineralivorans PML1(12)]